MIQIIFEFETQYGVFRDALHLPEDHTFTDEQIAAMKQERVDNWIAVVNPSPEQIEAMRLQQLALDETPTEEV